MNVQSNFQLVEELRKVVVDDFPGQDEVTLTKEQLIEIMRRIVGLDYLLVAASNRLCRQNIPNVDITLHAESLGVLNLHTKR